MTDCPHIHIQDSGLQAFREIILEETDNGRDIVRFLKSATNREYSNYEPQHELKAAEILAKYGYEDAAEKVRRHKASRPRRPSSNGSRNPNGAPDLNKAEDRDPGVNEFVQFIRDETDNGRTIVRNLIHAMETHEDPYKPHHNLAAAKQLIDNGFPLTNAVMCSPDCSHHSVKKANTPSDTPEADSTQEEIVPDPKWLAAVAEVQRMKDEGILTPDPNAPEIDYSIHMSGTEEEIAPYADEVAAKFRAEIELRLERRAQWPEVEERRRKKLAQMYPSHSDGGPPDT